MSSPKKKSDFTKDLKTQIEKEKNLAHRKGYERGLDIAATILVKYGDLSPREIADYIRRLKDIPDGH